MMKNGLILSLLLLSVFSCHKPEFYIPEGYIDETFWVENNGAHLYTSARGNATTDAIIIHVHGGPALGSHEFYYVRPLSYRAMEEEGIVIYYDQRGIGLSTGNFGKDKYTVEQFIDDLDQVVDVVRLKYGTDKNIFLFGRSWGGKLTINYLVDEARQAKITGWISTNGAHDVPLIRSTGKQLLMDVANEQIDLGHSVNSWKKIREFAENFDPSDASENNQSDYGTHAYKGMELLKDDGQIMERNEATWLSGDEKYKNTALVPNEITWNDFQNIGGKIYNQLLTESVLHLVDQIEIPVLMIYGEYDLICTPQMGQIVFDKIGTPTEDKIFIVYENIGHGSISAPDRFSEDFQTFITQYNK